MTETEPEKPPMDKTVLSIMEMPTISGINLKMSCIKGARRSSMFDTHPRSFHGKIETHSRGSFSLKGVVDPAVGLFDKSQEITNLSLQSISRLAQQLPGVPNDMVYHTESKDTIESQKKLAPQYENTFQLDPQKKPTRKELSVMLKNIKDEIPAETFKYDFDACTKFGQELAGQVIAECHKLELQRYRFLCMSTVMSRDIASAQQASRQLWDHNRDTWDETNITLPNAHIFLQLYCIYLD